ncbi:MAG: fenitrothion hydrolase [Solirubrobacteraceae bacterium]
MRRHLAAAGALALAGLAVTPAGALAHGLVGKQDLPIPRWLFAWAAAVVLVVSFVGLAVLWPTPRLEKTPERRLLRVPLVLEVLCGAFGVFAFGAAVYAGFAGVQSATANLMPTMVYVVFWVAIPFSSLLFGDVFAAVNPWRAVARAGSWLFGRVRGETPAPLAYPAWLGQWPAALGILAFAWLELVYSNRDDPSLLAVLALAYATVQLVGMSLFGIREWERNADAFAVYFGFFARLSLPHWRRRLLSGRPPLVGVARIAPVAGTVALLCVGIGTTSFDGMSQGAIWTGQEGIAPHLQQRFVNLGFTGETALEITFTLGLVVMVGLVSGTFRLGVVGMRSVGGGYSAGELARLFAPSLVPIAMAYVIAHYFSLLVYQGQAMAYLVSDPLGTGSNLFGTASKTIDYSVISANGVWYVQVVALILGHAAGLTLAHDRALTIYDDPRQATRSQYWMLAVMVGFTSLGLYILSAAAQ